MLRIGAHDADGVPAGDVGQHRVEQEQVGPHLVEQLEQVPGVGGVPDDDAVGAEHGAHDFGEVGVVVDDEHAHALGLSEHEELVDGGAERVGLDGLREEE